MLNTREYGIPFIFSLLCEYVHLEYVRRENQAEYGIHILAIAPQEYVIIYSTRSVSNLGGARSVFTPAQFTPQEG